MAARIPPRRTSPRAGKQRDDGIDDLLIFAESSRRGAERWTACEALASMGPIPGLRRDVTRDETLRYAIELQTFLIGKHLHRHGGIPNAHLATAADLEDQDRVSRSIREALHRAGHAVAKCGAGHRRRWTVDDLRRAYPSLKPGKLKNLLTKWEINQVSQT